MTIQILPTDRLFTDSQMPGLSTAFAADAVP